MSDWMAYAVGVVFALFLWVNGALMLFDLKRFFALQDWLTRADRWGSKRDPNWTPEHVGQWRLAGVGALIAGTVVAGMLLTPFVQPPQPSEPAAPPDGYAASSMLLGFLLVSFGLWIVLRPASFVKWALSTRPDRVYPSIDFDRMGTKRLIGIRLFGLIFVLLGVTVIARWST
jgi:hypothetical protein